MFLIFFFQQILSAALIHVLLDNQDFLLQKINIFMCDLFLAFVTSKSLTLR